MPICIFSDSKGILSTYMTFSFVHVVILPLDFQTHLFNFFYYELHRLSHFL